MGEGFTEEKTEAQRCARSLNQLVTRQCLGLSSQTPALPHGPHVLPGLRLQAQAVRMSSAKHSFPCSRHRTGYPDYCDAQACQQYIYMVLHFSTSSLHATSKPQDKQFYEAASNCQLCISRFSQIQDNKQYYCLSKNK